MKLIFTALISCTAFSNSYANSNITSNLPSSSTHSIGESELTRENKKFSIALRSGSIAGGIYGSGVDFSLFTKPHTQFGFEYITGVEDLKSKASLYSVKVNYNRLDLKAQLLGVYGKYFTGNSFAINGGVYYRTIESHMDLSSATNSDIFLKSTPTESAIIMKLGIGNYWSWNSGFSLGCEWVNYQIPIANKTYNSDTNGSKLNSSELNKTEKIINDLAKFFSSANTLQVLNLYVGYQF